MNGRSLEDAIESAGGPVSLLRDLGVGRFTRVRDAYTHWIEEQRAWRESCALADQSYHMTDFEVSGPDAVDLYRDFAVNGFEDFSVGQAKQLVVCNPDGYFIGDAILFDLPGEDFLSVGAAAAHNWLEYNAEIGDYDVTTEMRGRPVATNADPKYFRYQVQGPNAVEVVQEVTADPLSDLGFFRFTDTAIDGVDVHVLRHGMAGEAGFEFWGEYEDGEAVKNVVLDAGEEHGIRRLGSKSYLSANTVLGWIPIPLPAIYDGEAMRPYREWLDARHGILSIGGSFESDDVSDYYVTPIELGYGHIVDFDHDFVGRDALEGMAENPERKRVTLVWNENDVHDVNASLYDDGETYKFIEYPITRTSAAQYDEVRRDGQLVGVSKWMSYIYNQRALLSLALVDVDHADPGTQVTLTWGEPNGSTNPKVERHTQTEIRATVAPAPYKKDNR